MAAYLVIQKDCHLDRSGRRCLSSRIGLGLEVYEQPSDALDGEYEALPTANNHTNDK